MARPEPRTPGADPGTGSVRTSSLVERRSIDWVPPSERSGTVRQLGPIWFVVNVNLTAVATGTTALSIGASLGWTVVATTLGSLFGTVFMALHSAQGPKLGLPQLVQSRAQFGYLGAAFTVWIFALVMFVAYNIANTLLVADAFNELFNMGATFTYWLSGTVAAIVAILGYRWIHLANRILAVPLLLILVLLVVALAQGGGVTSDVVSPSSFDLAPVATVFVIAAGFQLGWAPYVSDYSRYLPESVRASSTFWWTFVPCAMSGAWVFAVGAFLGHRYPGVTTIGAIDAAGDSVLNGLGALSVLVMTLSLLSIIAINQYGGMMAMISIVDSVKSFHPGRVARIAGVLAMLVVACALAQVVGVENFNAFYANVLVFLAYLFTPWTAINLTDYFLVRKGNYSIPELFNPRGIYGRWGWRGNSAYAIAVLAMLPFFVTEPFVGAAAQRLGNVDISLFVGLVVASLVYWILCRSLPRDLPATVFS